MSRIAKTPIKVIRAKQVEKDLTFSFIVLMGLSISIALQFKHMELQFRSLPDMLLTFNTEEKCKSYLEQQRWKGAIVCPHCGGEKVWRTTRGFKCGKPQTECGKKFTVTVGTVFERTHIPLQKWFAALYLFTAHKKGVSSCQLARDLDISQHTAWFMIDRSRTMPLDKMRSKYKRPKSRGIAKYEKKYFIELTFAEAVNRFIHKLNQSEYHPKTIQVTPEAAPALQSANPVRVTRRRPLLAFFRSAP
jgi:transposase-like protein